MNDSLDIIISTDRAGSTISENAGNNKIKFRAASFKNAKVNRYKLPVEQQKNSTADVSLETQEIPVVNVTGEKSYDLTTKQYLMAGVGEKRDLKLKKAREQNIALSAPVVMNMDERKKAQDIKEEVQEETPVKEEKTVESKETEESNVDTKPTALENTMFDLGGILENAVATKSATSKAKKAEPVPTPEPKEEQDEIDPTIDLGDNESLKKEVDKVNSIREEVIAANKKASQLGKTITEKKKSAEAEIKDANQRAKVANSDMQAAASRRDSSKAALDAEKRNLLKVVKVQAQIMAAQKAKVDELNATREKELQELEDATKKTLDTTNSQIADDVAKADSYNKEADDYEAEISAILELSRAVQEPIDFSNDVYVPASNVISFEPVQEESSGYSRRVA